MFADKGLNGETIFVNERIIRECVVSDLKGWKYIGLKIYAVKSVLSKILIDKSERLSD